MRLGLHARPCHEALISARAVPAVSISMVRAGPIIASVALALLVLQPVDAAHCTTYSTTVTDLNEGVVVIEIAGGLYIPITVCHAQCTYGWSVGWYYAETNGIPGLQRIDPVKDDTCHWSIEADNLIW